ncbi:(2Fe-2S) ferredoxin domain-containing protein [Algoriphagus sanaruensis]|uniref:NAD-reducing hydrogenase, alpha subunit n=1 Tax=Algoriphagus sanaruensis TaxID=1727163 RepID=A0A142EPZ6_9BACT|nr:(2Fe-2S) ferredoxin domain-containing protein [Algoriphagus sanaruensis]AMQ57201.1 NAD-reducing hydrogenase, alpha subunit [Algoriphagus sanaruensis]
MGSERQFLFLCQGKDCKKLGAKLLKKEIKSLLQAKLHRGKFQLVLTKCMDRCKSGPICALGNEVLKRVSIRDIEKKIKEATSLDSQQG